MEEENKKALSADKVTHLSVLPLFFFFFFGARREILHNLKIGKSMISWEKQTPSQIKHIPPITHLD